MRIDADAGHHDDTALHEREGRGKALCGPKGIVERRNGQDFVAARDIGDARRRSLKLHVKIDIATGFDGEGFTDTNGNGEWDEDMGLEGVGDADSVVLYRVTYEVAPATPFTESLLGRFTLVSTAAVRNAPF